MATLKLGDAAPNFSLPADTGKAISLKELKGKKVILYFYPKDDTPGCTKQACEYTEMAGQFEKKHAVILGVSCDGLESHAAFKTKYNIKFPLLSDPDHKVHELYGAWGEKTSYGKTTIGAIRTTVVIGEDGKILSWEGGVKAEGNAAKVLGQL